MENKFFFFCDIANIYLLCWLWADLVPVTETETLPNSDTWLSIPLQFWCAVKPESDSSLLMSD